MEKELTEKDLLKITYFIDFHQSENNSYIKYMETSLDPLRQRFTELNLREGFFKYNIFVYAKLNNDGEILNLMIIHLPFGKTTVSDFTYFCITDNDINFLKNGLEKFKQENATFTSKIRFLLTEKQKKAILEIINQLEFKYERTIASINANEKFDVFVQLI